MTIGLALGLQRRCRAAHCDVGDELAGALAARSASMESSISGHPADAGRAAAAAVVLARRRRRSSAPPPVGRLPRRRWSRRRLSVVVGAARRWSSAPRPRSVPSACVAAATSGCAVVIAVRHGRRRCRMRRRSMASLREDARRDAAGADAAHGRWTRGSAGARRVVRGRRSGSGLQLGPGDQVDARRSGCGPGPAPRRPTACAVTRELQTATYGAGAVDAATAASSRRRAGSRSPRWRRRRPPASAPRRRRRRWLAVSQTVIMRRPALGGEALQQVGLAAGRTRAAWTGRSRPRTCRAGSRSSSGSWVTAPAEPTK